MKRFLRALLPVAILVGGIAIAMMLVRTRPEPPREVREEAATLVEIEVAEKRAHRVEVQASGTVTPARQVALTPEIAGRVVWVSERLAPGSRFRAGDVMVRLDAREHELAVNQQRAEVDRVRTELEIERGRVAVAEREWEIFADQEAGEPGGQELALRQPQLRTARAAAAAAQSGLERAQLNVARTRLRAPFNAVVLEKNVDVGQHVGPTAPVAALVGTDEFWVQVSLPIHQLAWIDVPGVGGVDESEGSTARVVQRVGDKVSVRDGRVVRLLGDVDPAGRMARVLVSVDDPYDLRGGDDSEGAMPLLVGSYVDVEIAASEVQQAVAIPRVALRDGDHVYVMNADDRLDIRDVSVRWRDRERVLVSEGLDDGDRVIVSAVPAPAEGMKLRRLDDGDRVAGGDGTPAEQGGDDDAGDDGEPAGADRGSEPR